MSLTTVIFIIWGVFWAYWLLAAFSAKAASRRRARPFGILVVVAFVFLRRVHGLVVHSTVLKGVGLALLVAGLGLAVWARIYLGRNWGMPMTEKEEPELVTSGPYRFVRHPIYSGLLLGFLGTTLATSLAGLVAFAVAAAYFIYSARVEERLMTDSFPVAYPSYRARTKLLIPFVL